MATIETRRNEDGTTGYRAKVRLSRHFKTAEAKKHTVGELISFDGHFFHCQDRKCRPAADDQLLSWAAVCNFKPEDNETPLLTETLSYAEGKVQATQKITFDNQLFALKIVGTFEKIDLVNIPAQKKPYPPIEKVAAQAERYALQNIAGSIVGWFAPDFMGPIKNVKNPLSSG